MHQSLIYHVHDKQNHHIRRNEIKSIKNIKDKVLGRSYEKGYLSLSANDGYMKGLAFNKISLKETTNDSLFINQYATQTLEDQRNQQIIGYFLDAHEIDGYFRARMLDWMIEVITMYNFNHSSYFYSVYIMDKYCRQQKQRIQADQLHIIGVVALLIASKMNQVFPLKIKTVYEKIGHRKLPKNQLIEMQNKMMKSLNFNLNCWTFYDHAMLKLTQLHEHQISTKSSNEPLFQNEHPKSKNQDAFKEMQKICCYVCMHVIFEYEFYNQSTVQQLGEGCVKMVLQIMNIDETPIFFFKTQLFVLEKIRNKIFKIVKSFKMNHSDASNIFKFTEQKIQTKVSSPLN